MAENTAPETFSADDEDDILEGDVAQFFALHQIPRRKYSTMLKRMKSDGTGYETLGSFKNEILSENEIGEKFGDGKYTICFTWYVKGAPKEERNRIENLQMELPEYPWRGIHLKYRRKQLDDEQAQEKARRQTLLEEAQIEGAKAGPNGTPKSDLDSLRSAAATLKELGINIAPQQSGFNMEKLMGYAVALAPVFAAVIPLFKRDDTLLLALLGKQQEKTPETEKMASLMETMFNLTKRTLELAAPKEEKDSIVDRLFDMVETVGPSILAAIASKSPEAKAKDRLYQAATNSDELKKVKEDPALLEALVNRFDEAYGFQQTNETLIALIKDIGLTRPESTAGNKEKFPSEGYNKQGEKVPSSE